MLIEACWASERLTEPTRLTLYVDGSCDGNQNVDASTSAGWGVVVVQGDSGLGRGSGEIITELSGPVKTSSDDEEFIGAEVGSNNTAELSGLFAALRWLLTEEEMDPVRIRLDSQYAGNIATGAWRAKANRELAARVQSVWDEVASRRTLSWDHVRAHRGHRWNERADHLAKRAMKRERPLPLSFWKPGVD